MPRDSEDGWPASQTVDGHRAAEVAAKLDRVRAWLRDSAHQAALFTTQAGVAWVTAGLEDRVSRNEEPALVWALVTEHEAHLITNNVEEPRLLAEEQVATLGFQVRVQPWHRPGGLGAAVDDLTSGMRLANDGHGPGVVAPDELAALRLPLMPAEGERLTRLGEECAEAIEASLRNWRASDRECEVAGAIAAALEERRIFPSLILVGGAARRRRFRHPVPTDAVCGSDALAAIVGYRWGLNVSCSRSVAAGPPDPTLTRRHRAACAVEAAMINATRPGLCWEDVLDAAKAAYEAVGFPGEWQAHLQGGPVGYLSREFDVVPGTAAARSLIPAGAAFAWNPTVQGGKSEDTFLLTEAGPRSISNTDAWPTLVVEADSGPIRRPAILQL